MDQYQILGITRGRVKWAGDSLRSRVGGIRIKKRGTKKA
jgi:hypothetical protein